MLKHMPSGSAVGHQHHQQHPQHPPPPPPQIQARTAAIAAGAASATTERAAHNRSIQPLNVSTISHQTAATSYTPNKHIPNGHTNGPLRLPPTTILNTTPLTSCSSFRNHSCNYQLNTKHRVGAREALTSLGLLCLGIYSQNIKLHSINMINKNIIFFLYFSSFSFACITFINFSIENFSWWS